MLPVEIKPEQTTYVGASPADRGDAPLEQTMTTETTAEATNAIMDERTEVVSVEEVARIAARPEVTIEEVARAVASVERAFGRLCAVLPNLRKWTYAPEQMVVDHPPREFMGTVIGSESFPDGHPPVVEYGGNTYYPLFFSGRFFLATFEGSGRVDEPWSLGVVPAESPLKIAASIVVAMFVSQVSTEMSHLIDKCAEPDNSMFSAGAFYGVESCEVEATEHEVLMAFVIQHVGAEEMAPRLCVGL